MCTSRRGTTDVAMWGGVDVGGRRKGFHAAVVDERRLVAGPTRLATASAVLDWLEDRATLVAVDSPCAPAPDGSSSRPEERALAAAVCGIRYTPAASALTARCRDRGCWQAFGPIVVPA